jgi:hypothetical protein
MRMVGGVAREQDSEARKQKHPLPKAAVTVAATRKRELGNFRSERLELGVGVRTDFAVQINLFVLRGYPFHG